MPSKPKRRPVKPKPFVTKTGFIVTNEDLNGPTRPKLSEWKRFHRWLTRAIAWHEGRRK